MRAVKTYAEVGSDKSLILKSLPFAPGSRVEVIVFPTADGGDVFPTMDRIAKKKGIKSLTMKRGKDCSRCPRRPLKIPTVIDTNMLISGYLWSGKQGFIGDMIPAASHTTSHPPENPF